MGTHPIFESDFDCLTEMLENTLDYLENEQNKKFQIMAKVDHLMSSKVGEDSEPEIPPRVRDKLNRIDQICRDKIIEVSNFSTDRLEFAKEFSKSTGSDAFMLPSAIQNNVDTQRMLIDQISAGLRSSKTPRQKNEVKNWSTEILKDVRRNLSMSFGNREQSSCRCSALHFPEETVDLQVEKEIQKAAREMAENAETVREIRDAFILLNDTRNIPTFVKSES